MPTMIMPKMGDGMEEGTLLRWLKSEGEELSEGDLIAEIETDKVTLEIEASETGVLTKTLVDEGQTVPVGTPIATIGEDAPAEAAPAEAAASATNGRAPAAAPAPAPVATERHADADGAAIDAMNQAAAIAPAIAPGNGSAAPAPVGATAAPRAAGERLRASPLVKRLAAEHGIDLQGVMGTGPGGRIVKDDITPLLSGILTAVPAVPTAPAAAPEQTVPSAGVAPAPSRVAASVNADARPAGAPREMSRIRRTTGRRMTESKQAVPHFYVTSEVDMAAAAAFRDQVNAQITDDATKVSFNDLIVKAAAIALREFPNLNVSLEGDQLVDHPNVDINIAVAIEGGLIAPFIPDADQKSLGAIARMAKDLIGRARNGGLKPEEFQGGTFTISNLGMYDVEEFIAIINPPQAAILAIGSIKEVPVVSDGEVTVGQRMNISLSADHRVTDGAEVAKFLQVVKRSLHNPMLLALS